jgi:hypothetical protein
MSSHPYLVQIEVKMFYKYYRREVQDISIAKSTNAEIPLAHIAETCHRGKIIIIRAKE